MEDGDFDVTKCVLSLDDFDKEKPQIQLREKVFSSIIDFCKIRNHGKLESQLKRCVELKTQVLVHKNYRGDFTDIKRTFNVSEDNSPVPS